MYRLVFCSFNFVAIVNNGLSCRIYYAVSVKFKIAQVARQILASYPGVQGGGTTLFAHALNLSEIIM